MSTCEVCGAVLPPGRKAFCCWDHRNEGFRRRLPPLTAQQKKTMDFICRCYLKGYLPTHREIHMAVGGGNLAQRFRRLVAKGWLCRPTHGGRYRLTEKALQFAHRYRRVLILDAVSDSAA